MDTDQKNVDLSNYFALKKRGPAATKPPDFGFKKSRKKNMVYIAIIAVCALIGIVMGWEYYKQTVTGVSPADNARDAETGEIIPR